MGIVIVFVVFLHRFFVRVKGEERDYFLKLKLFVFFVFVLFELEWI